MVPRIHCGVGGIEPSGDWKTGLHSETAPARLVKSAFASVVHEGTFTFAH